MCALVSLAKHRYWFAKLNKHFDIWHVFTELEQHTKIASVIVIALAKFNNYPKQTSVLQIAIDHNSIVLQPKTTIIHNFLPTVYFQLLFSETQYAKEKNATQLK